MPQVYAPHDGKVRELVAEKICNNIPERETTKTKSQFRIFSIGCGDGEADYSIIQLVTERLPDMEIHYVGTDIDEESCQQARERLGSLKNVNAETFVLDFERVDSFKVEVSPCDLVLAVHFLTYMRDINKALSDALKFKKPDGIIRLNLVMLV